jgi:hypothetical protein
MWRWVGSWFGIIGVRQPVLYYHMIYDRCMDISKYDSYIYILYRYGTFNMIYIYIYSIWINLFDVHQNISTCTFCMKQTFPICHSPFVAGILKNGLQHISTILQHISTAWVSPLTGLPEGGGNWTTGGSDSVKNPNRFSMIHV